MRQHRTGRDRFVEYLVEHADDRAMLAALRRGLGQPPGAVPEVSKYVQPWLGRDSSISTERGYYTIAPLFALHPAEGNSGNMGSHMAMLAEPESDPPSSVERRFMLLLSADADDLPEYLRQAVSLLKSKDVPINWQQLLTDVLAWNRRDERPRLRVRRQWSREFWRPRVEEQPIAAPDDSIPVEGA